MLWIYTRQLKSWLYETQLRSLKTQFELIESLAALHFLLGWFSRCSCFGKTIRVRVRRVLFSYMKYRYWNLRITITYLHIWSPLAVNFLDLWVWEVLKMGDHQNDKNSFFANKQCLLKTLATWDQIFIWNINNILWHEYL